MSSGIILPDRAKSEKKDNICKCLGVGGDIKVIRRTDILHYKQGFGKKLIYEGEKYIVLTQEEVIAIERDVVVAPENLIICKLVQEERIGRIVVPDNVKQNSGDYFGEVVASSRDEIKKGDKIVFLRNEGYRFRTLDREDLISIKMKWIYGRWV